MDWRKDDHMKWIKAGVSGWCDDGNIQAMATAIENMPDGAVIEIGSFVGRSTCIISRLLELAESPAPFYSVDDWYFEGYHPDGVVSKHVTLDNWRGYTEQQFIANVSYFTGRRPLHIKTRSDDFFRQWGEGRKYRDLFGRRVRLGGGIAFAFIDGEHSYDGSKRDAENTLRFLLPGGYMLLDDSYDGTPHQSGRMAIELLAHPLLELVGRYPNMMFKRRNA